MIPDFPLFKKLELSDEEDLRTIVDRCNLRPYADFCFVNMWIWNTGNDMQISKLHDNLVVVFRDYVSREAFLSFVGHTELEKTTRALLEFSKKHYKIEYLKLVPQEVAEKLPAQEFCIIEDQDSHDYIYRVSHLADMIHWKNDKGKNVRGFIKKHPEYEIKQVSLTDFPVEAIRALFDKWGKIKKIETVFDLNEYSALERLLSLDDKNIKAILLYSSGVLLGFTVYEVIGDGEYAISRFAKADTSFDSSIYDILNWEEAKLLERDGITYYNWEQDLGIPGLRYSKTKYQPLFFLNKFTITFSKQ